MSILGSDRFKIYVPTLDEENLIGYTLGALLKVFPADQIEVIDLGSDDDTLARVPAGVKINHVTLPPETAGQFFTALKTEYSKKQEWVLWVDGDEIYPTHTLQTMKRWLETTDKKSLRVYWKILDQRPDGMWVSNEYLSAGAKLFNSNYFHFRRAWPEEVISPETVEHTTGEKQDFTGIWFWHGVLLDRSRNLRKARRKKAASKRDRYLTHLTFSKMIRTPWEMNYTAQNPDRWDLVNMAEGAFDKRWSGAWPI